MNKPVVSPGSRSLSLGKTFSALKYPNYRLWFVGQLVSLVGTWMQTTAQGYLVYQLTGSSAYLGYVSFSSGVPSLLFMLYGGVIADRMSRRKLLLITQVAMMILAFTLAGMVFWGHVQPWQIVIVAFFSGLAQAFDAPARQAFVLEMVDREALTNAIALNSTMFNAATVVGPAVAGLTYAAVGPAMCFTLNGISFIAVIAALLLMRLKPFVRPVKTNPALVDMTEGLRFVAREPTIRMLIGNLAFVSLFGFSLVTLVPAWAVKILGGDVRTNGLLLSARGLGALVSALIIASTSHLRVRGKLWTIGSFTLPLCTLILATYRTVPVSLLAFAGIGWSLMVLVNTTNAMVQVHIPDELRGRVMGVYMLVFQGAMPIGSLMVGTVAASMGEPTMAYISTAIMLALGISTYFLRPSLRKLD